MTEIHPDSIFALTIKQPWASLIAVGVKTVENRTWQPPASWIGSRIAIHAGKNSVPMSAFTDEEKQALADLFDTDWRHSLPRGILGTVEIARVTQVIEGDALLPEEEQFGAYEAGTYRWHLSDFRPLPQPVAVSGRLGLWRVTVPLA